MTRDASRTCGGSSPGSPNRPGRSEFGVRTQRGSRGGGASPQVGAVAAAARRAEAAPEGRRRHPLLPSVSGVDDSESECGLDAGVRFDWTIDNEAGGASLLQQLQPLLRLARESAQRH